MDLLENLLKLLDSSNSNDLVSLLSNVFATNNTTHTQTDFQTDYYSMPNYQYNQSQTQTNAPVFEQQPQNNFGLQNILKIVGVLLQFFGNKKKETQNTVSQPQTQKNSVIDTYKRVE